MPEVPLSEQLAPLLKQLKQQADAGPKLLELAAALANKGLPEHSAYVEMEALQLGDPATTHRWRLIQAGRAPANQFLLLNDDQRTRAFRRALSEQVSNGDLVLEIGTGSGILAMLAADAGAAQVVTCERQPLMARIAETLIRENGYSDVIHVAPKPLHELRIGIDLSRRADVLVSDLFTGALLEAGGLKLIRHAKREFTDPECRVIPSTATIRGRLVGGTELERLCRTSMRADFDLSSFNLFSPPTIQIQPERFATLNYHAYSEVIDCFEFSFNTLDGFRPRQRVLDVSPTRCGSIVGLLQWIKVEVSPGTILESDESSEIGWARYLHIFPNPIESVNRETIKIHLEHNWTRFSIWPEK